MIAASLSSSIRPAKRLAEVRACHGPRRRRERALVAVLALAAATALAGGVAGTAAAGQATTAPGSVAPIKVVITEGKVVMNPAASAPRGAAALFTLKNDTGSTVRFTLLGRVSKPIAPHGRGGLIVYLLRRGAFVVTINLSSHHNLRKTFVVY